MGFQRAQERVKELKRFYRGLLWFGIVAVFLFFSDTIDSGTFEIDRFDGSIILGVWAIILLVKALQIFILNPDWERRTLEKEIKKF